MQSPIATERLLATTDHLIRSQQNLSDRQQPWIHPRLIQSVDPIKGRQLRVSQPVRKGELLLVDLPYALIPVVDHPDQSEDIRCSNPACHRRVARTVERVSCPTRCSADAVWCNASCREADNLRHGVECTWLKKYATSIRSKWGEYDFGMLWLIVRILANRHVEFHNTPSSDKTGPDPSSFETGWNAIQSFCGSQETWAHSQVRHWALLVKKYLGNSPSLPHGMTSGEVLDLICQEEANSFGLYPRETGAFPLPEPAVDRGEQFGAGVYPTAALANHSCSPNIMHKPDNQSRMVFVASKDIATGEECCISYFDLSKKVELQDRREHLQGSFRFVCKCNRCVSEEPPQEEVQWDEFPSMEDF
ncbi:set and mynd domain containing protein [Aspergillus bombycis]|uniref:Set and mynd domain containing protein n=1 Tax=Aspergillus bombycis TaxID=109264 RepID=A0A1F7ZTD8_9EURO|nr:set and mynd domain containing protein [Aspergillus bombycis]OGM42348.1 set and mynd domain containing protein [Aspergillus bombycis]